MKCVFSFFKTWKPWLGLEINLLFAEMDSLVPMHKKNIIRTHILQLEQPWCSKDIGWDILAVSQMLQACRLPVLTPRPSPVRSHGSRQYQQKIYRLWTESKTKSNVREGQEKSKKWDKRDHVPCTYFKFLIGHTDWKGRYMYRSFGWIEFSGLNIIWQFLIFPEISSLNWQSSHMT
jgi:hypothetical protein